MGRKKKVVTIGDSEYEITQLPATEAYDLYNELVAAVGPVLAEKLPQLQGEELDQVAIGALTLLAKQSIPRALMRDLRDAFARNSKVRVNGVFLELSERGIFDQHFSGRMPAIDVWVLNCAKHSFMSFLSESGDS